MALNDALLNLPGYAYSPLRSDNDEIRLLHVQPGLQSQPLECTLWHVRLIDNPKFETISYVWGKASIRSSLVLHGCAASVPASSAAAIRRVRLENGVRVIWIDAVCIDQTNVEERNCQVALMRKIYSQASGNIVYLGESDTARAALTAVQAIDQEIRAEAHDSKSLYTKLWSEGGGWKYPQTGFRSNVDLDALETLLSTPWFSRLWVLQEATAARTNTCLYGSAAIELSTVLTVALWIEHKYNHLPMSLYMTDGVKDGIELWEFVDSEHGEFRQGTSVGEALRIAQGLQTAQAEDKVFGILGLLKCVRSNSEGAIPKLLQPDYRKGFAAVYRDAARFALHENVTELDEVLGCIMHRSREELDDINHLSWVPRWDRPTNSSLDTAPIPVGKGRSACDEVSFPGDPATGTDPDTLYLHGILFSSAEQVAPLFDFRNDDVVHNQEWQRVVLEIINKCNRTDDDGMDRMLSTVLVAESSPDSRYADKLRTAAFQTCWAFVTEHGRLPKAADLTDHDTHSAHTAEEFAVDFFQACDQRRIFRTVNGRPGVGPKVMEGGDLITVLYGCQAAYVLRQYGEYYRIVGDCYVYGIMQGQAVREHKELGRSSTVFSIR